MAYSTVSLLLALVMQLAEGGSDLSPSPAPSTSSDGFWTIDDHDQTVIYAFVQDDNSADGTCMRITVGVQIDRAATCLVSSSSCASSCNQDDFVSTGTLGTYSSTDDWDMYQTFSSDSSCETTSKWFYLLSVYEASNQTSTSINIDMNGCTVGILLMVPPGTTAMVAPAASTSRIESIDEALAVDVDVKAKAAGALKKVQEDGPDVLKKAKKEFEVEKSHAAAILKKAKERAEEAKKAAGVPPPARRLILV